LKFCSFKIKNGNIQLLMGSSTASQQTPAPLQSTSIGVEPSLLCCRGTAGSTYSTFASEASI
jgi:hypothetical protein